MDSCVSDVFPSLEISYQKFPQNKERAALLKPFLEEMTPDVYLVEKGRFLSYKVSFSSLESLLYAFFAQEFENGSPLEVDKAVSRMTYLLAFAWYRAFEYENEEFVKVFDSHFLDRLAPLFEIEIPDNFDDMGIRYDRFTEFYMCLNYLLNIFLKYDLLSEEEVSDYLADIEKNRIIPWAQANEIGAFVVEGEESNMIIFGLPKEKRA